jgi:orotidine-5'-phosphate decarboxylase
MSNCIRSFSLPQFRAINRTCPFSAVRLAGRPGSDRRRGSSLPLLSPRLSQNGRLTRESTFNVPCVGYAHDLGAIGDLVRAGADFIALGDAVFADPRGAAAALRDAARLMAPTPEAAE